MFDEEINTPLPEDSERPEVIFTEGRVVYDGHTFDPALWADKYNTHVLCVFHMKIPRNDGWEQGFMPSIKIAYQPNASFFRILFLPESHGGGSITMMCDGFTADDFIPIKAVIITDDEDDEDMFA